MKIPNSLRFSFVLFFSCFLISCNDGLPEIQQEIVSSDIQHFYDAFDAIQKSSDSLEQRKLLRELFLDRASQGQMAMIDARNYSEEDYIHVMTSFPKFWQSLRRNTANMPEHNKDVILGVRQLKSIYPDLKPAVIYYTMGAFRSPGTGFDSKVLMGTEFALGDKNMDVSEFKGIRDHTANYYKIDPLQYLSFLTVHEYVHTQQKDIPDNLLSHTLREGFAEFVAMTASGQASPWKAMVYGPKNEVYVRAIFEAQLFNGRSYGNWMWNSDDNLFGHHDMSYYVGAKIAALYYEQAENKELAIKEIIELDFMDETAVEKFVESTGYFSATLEGLYEQYQKNKPKVVAIEPFSNGDQKVDPKITEVSVQFSKPMDTLSRGFDYGPLGEANVMRLSKYVGFSEDGTSVKFNVKLEPNKRYQLQLPNKYQDTLGNPMEPYLIDFKTGNKK